MLISAIQDTNIEISLDTLEVGSDAMILPYSGEDLGSVCCKIDIFGCAIDYLKFRNIWNTAYYSELWIQLHRCYENAILIH